MMTRRLLLSAAALLLAVPAALRRPDTGTARRLSLFILPRETGGASEAPSGARFGLRNMGVAPAGMKKSEARSFPAVVRLPL
jgi:hypothetical protein